MDQEIIDWLLQSDPSVAFQTKRDLLEMPRKNWQSDQLQMEMRGWVRQLLDLQDEDGTWGGGLYSPKFTSTHYTLQLLRRLEMYHTKEISKGCKQLVNINAIGNIPDTEPGRIDACITGMGLAILAHFGVQDHKYEEILEYIIANQMEDGGWNCRYGRRAREKTTHSSLNTTISVLEGLRELGDHDRRFRKKVEQIRVAAHEFLLVHRLFKSHRTGEMIHKSFADITFPPRWKYNILSALDYFRSIDHPYDERMKDAIELVEGKRRGGKWHQGTQLAGKTFFSINPKGQASPFNTLRALRVLKKYG